MIVKRRSILTGNVSQYNINITEEQRVRLDNGYELVQNIVPELSVKDREFLTSGMTYEEQDELFGNCRE